MITTQTGKFIPQRVSTSMPEKPKALSPSYRHHRPAATTAAATREAPCLAHDAQVPTSGALRGLYIVDECCG